ncbi:unnamed protein product [Caenorhabditis auriculariae]|uniref:Activin types I and II receptor domain-containing protein n=1 Tax=Caenorhabditis auriculariae TaxID=2777116 RepID=A0A8S1GMU7_9PELO|nr:unnamed protein product [Caenorhabditis auriculariae]
MFLFPLILVASASALQCYTGYSIIKGRTIGTETKNCSSDSDFCYNATADVHALSTVQKAGCNSLLCRFNANKCFTQTLAGKSLLFCCCNTGDRCNGGNITDPGSWVQRGLSTLKSLATFAG